MLIKTVVKFGKLFSDTACSEINVFVLPNGQFYIRNLMLNTNIHIILIKSPSVLSTMFHLIDLDLRCSTSKLILAFRHLEQAEYLAR